MFSKSKVTVIYCIAEDFCKEFTLQQGKYMVEDKEHKHRNKPNRMNDTEIIVILILFHSGGFRCFKHYYKGYVCKHLTHLFSYRVSYSRFVELGRKCCFLWLSLSRKSSWKPVRASALSIAPPCVSAVTNGY